MCCRSLVLDGGAGLQFSVGRFRQVHVIADTFNCSGYHLLSVDNEGRNYKFVDDGGIEGGGGEAHSS